MAGNQMQNKKRNRKSGLDPQGLPRVVGPVNPRVGSAFKDAYRKSQQGDSPPTKAFKSLKFTPMKDEGPATQRRTRRGR